MRYTFQRRTKYCLASVISFNYTVGFTVSSVLACSELWHELTLDTCIILYSHFPCPCRPHPDFPYSPKYSEFLHSRFPSSEFPDISFLFASTPFRRFGRWSWSINWNEQTLQRENCLTIVLLATKIISGVMSSSYIDVLCDFTQHTSVNDDTQISLQVFHILFLNLRGNAGYLLAIFNTYIKTRNFRPIIINHIMLPNVLT